MKPRIKKMWVEALRSGEYKQICNLMREGHEVSEFETIPDVSYKNNNMCVLGVLVDLALRKSGLKYNLTNWKKFAQYNESLTERTLEWAGITPEESQTLMDINDKRSPYSNEPVEGKTFVELADYIEKNL